MSLDKHLPTGVTSITDMAAIRYLFHRHHLSKRMLGLISEYGGKR